MTEAEFLERRESLQLQLAQRQLTDSQFLLAYMALQFEFYPDLSPVFDNSGAVVGIEINQAAFDERMKRLLELE